MKKLKMDYQNAKVNCMLMFLEQAYKDALNGKITDTCTNIRLAYHFQSDVPSKIKLDKAFG
jgi:hypothetical protein